MPEYRVRRVDRAALPETLFASLDELRREHPGASSLVLWLLTAGRTASTPRTVEEVIDLLDDLPDHVERLPESVRIDEDLSVYLSGSSRERVLEDAELVRAALTSAAISAGRERWSSSGGLIEFDVELQATRTGRRADWSRVHTSASTREMVMRRRAARTQS